MISGLIVIAGRSALPARPALGHPALERSEAIFPISRHCERSEAIFPISRHCERSEAIFPISRHCERSEAIFMRLLRCAPLCPFGYRNDCGVGKNSII